jgi:hypothetical protein
MASPHFIDVSLDGHSNARGAFFTIWADRCLTTYPAHHALELAITLSFQATALRAWLSLREGAYNCTLGARNWRVAGAAPTIAIFTFAQRAATRPARHTVVAGPPSMDIAKYRVSIHETDAGACLIRDVSHRLPAAFAVRRRVAYFGVLQQIVGSASHSCSFLVLKFSLRFLRHSTRAKRRWRWRATMRRGTKRIRVAFGFRFPGLGSVAPPSPAAVVVGLYPDP